MLTRQLGVDDMFVNVVRVRLVGGLVYLITTSDGTFGVDPWSMMRRACSQPASHQVVFITQGELGAQAGWLLYG